MCHMDVSAHADSGLLALASYTFPVKTGGEEHIGQ